MSKIKAIKVDDAAKFSKFNVEKDLKSALKALGSISYMPDWKEHEKEAIKLQKGISDLLSKLED